MRLLALALGVALLAGACSAGDARPDPTLAPAGESKPVASPASTRTVNPPAVSTPRASRDGTKLGGIFSSVFGGAFSGGASGSASGVDVGGGDESLKAFLPASADLPSGYKSFGEFTFRVPDGVSQAGGMDVAAKMALSGDVASGDPTSLGILMAMVIKPDDLQDLGSAFGEIKDLNKQDIEDEILAGAGSTPGFEIKDVRILDADGLGDGGFGMQMTIDMTGLADLFGRKAADSGVAGLGTMTMRMYMFARGDYAGAVLHMGFTDDLGADTGELALARVIDENLKATTR